MPDSPFGVHSVQNSCAGGRRGHGPAEVAVAVSVEVDPREAGVEPPFDRVRDDELAEAGAGRERAADARVRAAVADAPAVIGLAVAVDVGPRATRRVAEVGGEGGDVAREAGAARHRAGEHGGDAAEVGLAVAGEVDERAAGVGARSEGGGAERGAHGAVGAGRVVGVRAGHAAEVGGSVAGRVDEAAARGRAHVLEGVAGLGEAGAGREACSRPARPRPGCRPPGSSRPCGHR